MNGVNLVIVAGNLTRDPEIRHTPSGAAVASLSLAVNRKYNNNQTGETVEDVTFVDVDLWGRQAEVAGQYLTKGRPVMIEGRLQQDRWEDKDTGQKRSKLKVVGNRMHFLGGGGDGQQGGGRQGQSRSQGQRRQQNRPPQDQGGGDTNLDIPEDDIPF